MFLIVVILYISSYLVPDGVAYGLCMETLIAMMALSCFFKTDYHKSTEKSLWFCVSVHTITNAVCFAWFDNYHLLGNYLFAGESLLFITLYLYSKYRSYHIPSDEYNSFDTFIVLKIPRNFIDYLISFFFMYWPTAASTFSRVKALIFSTNARGRRLISNAPFKPFFPYIRFFVCSRLLRKAREWSMSIVCQSML